MWAEGKGLPLVADCACKRLAAASQELQGGAEGRAVVVAATVVRVKAAAAVG